MDSARIQYETALAAADQEWAAYQETGEESHWRHWKEASDTAHRWHRTIRLSGDAPKATEDDFDKLLAG
jgi:hypothetical protein